MQLHADWAITLACGAVCPYVPTTVEDWDIPDPAGKTVDEVRVIRDQIELRVQDMIEHRIDAIRADRTAHQLRLTRLLPGLIERFPELPEQEIRSCADAVLAEYIGPGAFLRRHDRRPQGARVPCLGRLPAGGQRGSDRVIAH